jgi:hypothetical protein
MTGCELVGVCIPPQKLLEKHLGRWDGNEMQYAYEIRAYNILERHPVEN